MMIVVPFMAVVQRDDRGRVEKYVGSSVSGEKNRDFGWRERRQLQWRRRLKRCVVAAAVEEGRGLSGEV
jgi:hypothetical protein